MFLENLKDTGHLGRLRGRMQRSSGRFKRDVRKICKCRNEYSYEEYKLTKKEAKKAIQEVRFKAYDELQQIWG